MTATNVTALASALASVAGRDPHEIEDVVGSVVAAGSAVVDAASRLHDAVTDESYADSPRPVLEEAAGAAADLVAAWPLIAEAAEGAWEALGLDRVWAEWRARAPERRAARAERQAARKVDTDGDGRPNRNDTDDDNDTVPDRNDPAPIEPGPGSGLDPNGQPLVLQDGRFYSTDGTRVWIKGAWRRTGRS